MAVTERSGAAKRKEHLPLALLLTFILVVGVGSAVALIAGHRAKPPAAAPNPNSDPERHAKAARQAEIEQRFQQGVLMLHSHQYEHAVTAFHRVLELEPQLPEAHVNMGYAMLGLQRYEVARSFFESATALRPMQANAYYGMALAYRGLSDKPAAIGAMRTYLHLAKADDAFMDKAKAALAQWERSDKSEKLPKNGKATQPK